MLKRYGKPIAIGLGLIVLLIAVSPSLAQPIDKAAIETSLSPPNASPGSVQFTASQAVTGTVSPTHVNRKDCLSCHLGNRPAGHFQGQCSNCHTQPGISWQFVKFNHRGFTNCVACHGRQAPANHFAGLQCSNCHVAGTTFKTAQVNHAGLTECATCHESVKPKWHFILNNSCGNCHVAGKYWNAVSMDHTGITERCRWCHGIPENHNGQVACTSCHNPKGWTNKDPHRFPRDHGGAGGDCATCHPGGSPSNGYTCFACHDQSDVVANHVDRPGFNLNCVQCHANGKRPGQ